MTFHPGQIVGEYIIDAPLGRGGLGAVYLATHQISQRREAMKILLPEQIGTPEMVERFRREIQLLAALNHPNIARLNNAFHFHGQLVMIMELVEGEDLRARSLRSPIPLPEILDFAAQTLLALDYAHARGVIHRDIKPANIMISPSGHVKVLDFGIAVSAASTDLTVSGSLIGSPTHIAPEQIRGQRALPQSDLYSLGVTLYELIAGQPPIHGATTFDLMMAHINFVPAPLRQLRPGIPLHLSNIIARSLEKDPAARFTSASDFLTALRAVSTSGPTQTLAPTSSKPISTEHTTPQTTANITLPTLNLDPLTRHLASFIGPIAKIVVNKLASQHTNLDQLYTAAARQIDNEADRQRFLRTRPL